MTIPFSADAFSDIMIERMAGTVCDDVDLYVYWDTAHPTIRDKYRALVKKALATAFSPERSEYDWPPEAVNT